MLYMDGRGYKKLQHAWHSGNSGDDPREIAVTLSTVALSVFLGSINETKNSYIRHFILLIIPVIFTFTDVGVNMLRMVPIGLLSGSLLLLIKDRRISFKVIRKSLSHNLSLRPSWITNFKALTFVSTAICICAVDFTIFPRKFAKTESFGLSIMDLGVGFYMVCSGLVAKKESFRRSIIGVVVLSIFGAVRVLSMQSVDYYEHVTEYGVHWNFFFTLAACRLIHTIFSTILPINTYWLALPLPFYHQAALQYGLQNWVLGNSQRKFILDANKEGIVSLPGYLAIYYCAQALGKFLLSSRSQSRLLLKIAFVCISSWLVAYSCTEVTGVSRRLCNLGYIAWVLALSTTVLFELIVVEILLESTESGWLALPLMTSISRNGLLFFLIANLLTGMINMNLPTLLLSMPVSYATVIAYSFVLCYVCHLFYEKDVTIKFW